MPTDSDPTTQVLEGSAQQLVVRDLEVSFFRKGAGAPLLYLHGSGMSHTWTPTHEELSKTFDVVAPDHPGFGDTPRPPWLDDFADLALHYRDLLDELGHDRTNLVGHGLGGWIAAEFATYYPERVNSLTLLAPTGLRPMPEDGPVVDTFRLENHTALDLALGDDAQLWEHLWLQGDSVDNAVSDYNESITEALLSWNPRYSLKLEHRLSRVDTPALVLIPEEDRLVPRSVAPRYAELLPQGNLEVIRRTGENSASQHLFQLQEPAQIATRVAALASTEAAVR